MSKLVLGSDVPELLVILHAGFTNRFGITFLVEPADLVGIECKLKFGEITYVAVLTDTTYSWTLTDEEVAVLINRPSTVLSLSNIEGPPIKLASGIVEVRL